MMVQAATRYMNAYSATVPTFKERIALLYVLNDVFFHATTTYGDSKCFMMPATTQYLPSLVLSVKSAPEADPKQVDKLLRLWDEKHYFPSDVFITITGGTSSSSNIPAQRTPIQKPKSIGHIADPYYLLPVSCMLKVVVLPLPKSISDIA
jgi:hypothetical protein